MNKLQIMKILVEIFLKKNSLLNKEGIKQWIQELKLLLKNKYPKEVKANISWVRNNANV